MGSVIATALGWTGLPKIVQELVALAGTALAVGLVAGYIHHRIYAEGIAAQQAADNKASAPLLARAKAETRAAQKRADRAEESYREEVTAAARAAARPLGPVRLCLDAHAGSVGLPEAGGGSTGAAGAGAGAGRVPRMSRGDPGLRSRPGPDLEGLLGDWAHAADQVSARLRECRARIVPTPRSHP